MFQGFLLGFSNGITCLAYCAPVLLPLLLSEGKRVRQNWTLLAQFMGGRLLGYLLFGLLAWSTSQLILSQPTYRALVFGLTYVLLAVLIGLYGLGKLPTICPASLKDLRSWLRSWPALLPLAMGFLTGLNLCPPFVAAFIGAAYSVSLVQSLLFFAAFFVGTAIYFIPVPFLGLLSRRPELQTIGRFVAVLMALYYLYSGIILFAGGITQL
jgi:sulfite exporter TauE/SafE